MESTNNNNNNNNQMLLSEFKELRKEISAMKTRIVQLEKSHEKQQEKLNILVRENHALKTELSINGNKAVGSTLKRKRTDQKDQDQGNEEQIEVESTPALVSAGKKTKTNNNNNNNDDDEAVVLPRLDNGDSFDSLSDDLLHKIVEFDGNCYSKFGSINKRCKNIYDVEEYKLKKQTCLFGYGTVDMILQHYLQKRREGTFDIDKRVYISAAVIIYNRLDAIDWIIQLGDINLLQWVCCFASCYGRIKILTKMFVKLNLTVLDQILGDINMCFTAARNGKLQTLKWLRKYGAKLDERAFNAARDKGHDEIVQYLHAEGCPGTIEDTNESSVGSNEEDGDY